jgi:hypothetical protein
MPISRLVVMLLALALASCTTRLVDFTIISTKNLDLSKGATFERGRSRVQGADQVFIMKEALDRAIESVPGAVAILDGVITQRAWSIPFIYGESGFLVEGTPLIDPALAAERPAVGPYRLARLSASGSLSSTQILTRDEFLTLRTRLFGE